jgi:transposase
MSDHYWLSEAQLERIKPYFPQSHGRPRVDDRRVISGIIHIIRNGLRWRDAPEGHTRPFTTALSAGHGWACSAGSSRAWPAKARSPSD